MNDIISLEITNEASQELGKMLACMVQTGKFLACPIYFFGGIFKNKNANSFIQKILQAAHLEKWETYNKAEENPTVVAVQQLQKTQNLSAKQDTPTYKDLTNLMVLPEYYQRLDQLLANKPSHQKIHFSDKSIETDASTLAYVKEKMQGAIELESDVENMEKAIELALQKDAAIGSKGLFAEFGVGLGKSANFIAQKIPHKTLYGFDWYKGLPEDWRAPLFLKGTYALKPGVKIPPLPLEKNLELVIGLFKETLPIFLKTKSTPLLFIHIDCDLYSSTKEIFDNIRDKIIDGTIIVFDEYFNYDGWQNHEFKAFQEFIKETGLSYEYVCYNKLHQQVTVKLSKNRQDLR